ncbi:MAG: hypothetical protein HY831_01235 [Candidatus Aenigmarchaeota archaeon]|nr:hypothetical protein [Candidatus Aenigmarchaeota archaeon]
MSELIVDFNQLEKKRERNKKERLWFIDWYTNWLENTPNEVWSKHHTNFINSGFIIANQWAEWKKNGSVIKTVNK